MVKHADTETRGQEVVDEMSATELLALARAEKAAEDAAAAGLLVVAAQWADLHPPESLGGEAVFTTAGSEHEEPVAGPGCPLVAEFCVAELGATLGMSTTAAKRLVGHALEIRHRLPRLWGRVQAGEVPAWRARLVAEATIHATPALSVAAAGWVDAQVAAWAARIGPAQLDRIVAEAIKRYGPQEPFEDPEDPDPPCPDARHVAIDTDQVGYHGTAQLTGVLDLADAIDLDQTLAQHAAQAKTLGSRAPLGLRRAAALGEIARNTLTLDLAGAAEGFDTVAVQPAQPPGAGPMVEQGRQGRCRNHDTATDGTATVFTKPASGLPAARQVVLHLHVPATMGAQGLQVDRLGRLEEHQQLVLLDQVKSWLGDSHTTVTLKPVIDLNTEVTTPGYPPTEKLREQVRLRDGTCVFPWCTRPARRCDLDHTVAFDHAAAAEGRPQPGPTTTSNLGCLCRFHHRLKTRARWRVEQLRSGVFCWTSPHGRRFLRDHTGTTELDPRNTGPRRP